MASRSRQPRNRIALAAAGLAVLLTAGSAALLLRPGPVAVPAALPAPRVVIETASIAQIRSHRPTDMSVIRLAESPAIVVLDFASLAKQGRTLDRVAALIEKGELPKDRILNPDELEQAVKAGGDLEAGFYYGHDYSAASLRRFFSIADRDRVLLAPEEADLRRLLKQLGWLDPDAVAGLISLPAVGADERVTVAARNAILAHELSHGAWFSDPAYAAYAHGFFHTALKPSEQAEFRAFLGREGYNAADAQLVENETQAYLVFTPDPLFFTPAQVGMTPERRTELRLGFLHGMPDGWLKDMLAELW